MVPLLLLSSAPLQLLLPNDALVVEVSMWLTLRLSLSHEWRLPVKGSRGPGQQLLKRGVLRYDGQDIPFLCQFTHKKGATRAPKPSPKPMEKQGDGVYLVTEHLMPMASVR